MCNNEMSVDRIIVKSSTKLVVCNFLPTNLKIIMLLEGGGGGRRGNNVGLNIYIVI